MTTTKSSQERRRACLWRVCMIALIALIALASPGQAEEADKSSRLPGKDATVKGCIEASDGPYDVVRSWTPVDGSRKISLLCGDHTKGVLHIDRDHGPLGVDDAMDHHFLNCLGKVLFKHQSKRPGRPPNSRVYLLRYGRQKSARVVVDLKTNTVLTAYAGDGKVQRFKECSES
jgi:hypothetical protein